MYSLDDVRHLVGIYMGHIAGLFKAGCRVTVLVRTPGHPDRDFMMTDDELTEIGKMVARRADQEPAATHNGRMSMCTELRKEKE